MIIIIKIYLFETGKSYLDYCRGGTFQEFPNLNFSEIHTANPGHRATGPDIKPLDN
jgi:hypothetical protein